MSKQDRQGARTPADLMYRFNFKDNLSEVQRYANAAKKSAEAASNAAGQAVNATNELDTKLNQRELFDRLTNHGQAQGIILDDEGNIFINASFLAAGVITSSDGSIQIDLINNAVIIGGKTVEWQDNGDGTFTLIGK
jgi:TPP-dependent 2-oxoacid decarboxylase